MVLIADGTVVPMVVAVVTPSDPLRIPDKDVDEMSTLLSLPLLLLLVVVAIPPTLLSDVPFIPLPPLPPLVGIEDE